MGALLLLLALLAPGAARARRHRKPPPPPPLCLQSDDRSVALRASFGRPDGYSSCAIVGSSGLMLRSRLGAEIDAHEFVVRLVWMRG